MDIGSKIIFTVFYGTVLCTLFSKEVPGVKLRESDEPRVIEEPFLVKASYYTLRKLCKWVCLLHDIFVCPNYYIFLGNFASEWDKCEFSSGKIRSLVMFQFLFDKRTTRNWETIEGGFWIFYSACFIRIRLRSPSGL